LSLQVSAVMFHKSYEIVEEICEPIIIAYQGDDANVLVAYLEDQQYYTLIPSRKKRKERRKYDEHLIELVAGYRNQEHNSMHATPSMGPQHELAKGFFRTAGAVICYILIDLLGLGRKKDEDDKKSQHSYRSGSSSSPSFGTYSF